MMKPGSKKIVQVHTLLVCECHSWRTCFHTI